MQLVNAYPPNYEDIKKVLNPPETAVFAYGNIIYNPSGGKVYPDLEKHEDTHRKQQEVFGSIELWWNRYLLDPKFREECEVEAYRAQYHFLKGIMTRNDLKTALFEFADRLSTLYGLGLSYQEAEQRIRKYNV